MTFVNTSDGTTTDSTLTKNDLNAIQQAEDAVNQTLTQIINEGGESQVTLTKTIGTHNGHAILGQTVRCPEPGTNKIIPIKIASYVNPNDPNGYQSTNGIKDAVWHEEGHQIDYDLGSRPLQLEHGSLKI